MLNLLDGKLMLRLGADDNTHSMSDEAWQPASRPKFLSFAVRQYSS
jgi:hypothetical protein